MALSHVLSPRPEMPLQPARASSMFRFARRPKIFGPALSEHFRYESVWGPSTGESGRGEVPPHLRVQRARS